MKREQKTINDKKSCKHDNTTITRVLATFLSPYNGHPLQVSGHAIRTALKIRVSCSFGLFTTEKTLNIHGTPATYNEFMTTRLNNYTPPFDVRKACAGNREPFKIPIYYPVAITFDLAGDQVEKLVRVNEFYLGGRRGTDHGRCKIVDTSVIDTAGMRLPGSAGWVTLVSPMVASRWPPFFKKRKVRTRKQFVIRNVRVTKHEVFPEGTIFKLENWFSPATFFEREKKAPSMGHGQLADLGFGEMHFWN
jgi:hypothetical protein